MLIRIVIQEVKRLLSRKRSWILISALTAILVYDIRVSDLMRDIPPSPPAAFVRAIQDTFFWLMPAIVGVSVGDSFAIDRRSSISTFVLTRGIKRQKYIMAKGIGMAISSCLLLTVSMLIAIITALSTKGLSSFIRADDLGMLNSGDRAFYLAHPWIFTLLYALLQMLASTSYLTTLLLLSVWVANPIAVSIIPFAIYIGTIILLPETAVNPEVYFNLIGKNGTMFHSFLFFATWLVLVATIAIVVYGKREEV